MEGALFLDVIIRESAAVLELLAGEDKALLVRRDAGDGKNCRYPECISLSASAPTTND